MQVADSKVSKSTLSVVRDWRWTAFLALPRAPIGPPLANSNINDPKTPEYLLSLNKVLVELLHLLHISNVSFGVTSSDTTGQRRQVFFFVATGNVRFSISILPVKLLIRSEAASRRRSHKGVFFPVQKNGQTCVFALLFDSAIPSCCRKCYW